MVPQSKRQQLLGEEEGRVRVGKKTKPFAPTFFKVAAMPSPPESLPPARRPSLASMAPCWPSLHSVRPRPCLHLFPEPAASPGCPTVLPGFKLNSFVLLPHIFMSHRVLSSVESASPKLLPSTPPLFLQDHILLRTSQAHLASQPLPPDSVFSSSASISLLCSKTLSGPIFPKNVTPNISACHSETSPYDDPAFLSHAPLQLLQPPAISPVTTTVWLCPPYWWESVFITLHIVTSYDATPTTLAIGSDPNANTYLPLNPEQVL